MKIILTLGVTLLLGACSGISSLFGHADWALVQANPGADNAEFVNLHVTNDLDEDIPMSVIGFEVLLDEEWQPIPINPDADVDFLMENRPVSSSDDENSISTILRFEDYLHPDYPTEVVFRIAVELKDTNGNHLETRNSNQFTLGQ
ncbi:MAG: hypothetical protein FWF59_01590 [Turicibacter sp.]|nr:hypothetical protein [Turicibacter sp.]